MNEAILSRHFAQIGADVKFSMQRRGFRQTQSFAIDVEETKRGETFAIEVGVAKRVEVVNVDKDRQHLLLMVEQDGRKDKLLCGLDERGWFAAAVPNKRGVTTVAKAMEALKPGIVVESQRKTGVKAKNRHKRNNKGFTRQGEWFFVPVPNVTPNEVFKKEPISRGAGSKPHTVEELFRRGGEPVMVYAGTILTVAQYERRKADGMISKYAAWRPMVRDAEVYCRGRVSHADHKTITLDGWHRCLMNTEAEAPAAHSIAFLD